MERRRFPRNVLSASWHHLLESRGHFLDRDPVFTKQQSKILDRDPVFTKQQSKILDRDPVFTKQQFKILDRDPVFTKQRSKILDRNPVFTKQQSKILTSADCVLVLHCAMGNHSKLQQDLRKNRRKRYGLFQNWLDLFWVYLATMYHLWLLYGDNWNTRLQLQ
jgi:hypothetical protein